MPTEIGPKQLQRSVKTGFDRLRNFRDARLMFIRQFVGQYYDRDHGSVASEPLNLIFNAIRILVPQLVMNFPKYHVQSQFLDYWDYAELAGLGLDFNSKQIDIRSTYRRFVVDSLFTVGILKTGLASSDTVVGLDEFDEIDTGTIYTDNVDFDNWVCDPDVRGDFREGAYQGDRLSVPRQELLDSGLYENDLIERLPSLGDTPYGRGRVADLSRSSVSPSERNQLLDEVEVVEVYVPRANAIVTVPGDPSMAFDRYLRITDYHGPKEGPYTYLSFSPPVPGNAMPVATVGIWHDVHVMANRMAKKIMQQADRQKDVLTYKRSAADDAQEFVDAGDGEAIAVDDNDGIKVHSYGGQQQSNEVHLQQLQMWFNMMASNPQGVGGLDLRAASATEASILQGNSNVLLEDQRDLLVVSAEQEARKRFFYMHTDPLIRLPLVQRKPMQTPDGVMMKPQQVYLTPEVRRGDFIDYTLKIQPESMQRVDSKERLRQALEFASQILPVALQAAQIAAMIGIPFNVQLFIENMAKDRGIEWFHEVWYDPMFQQKQRAIMLAGPQQQQQADSAGGQQPGSLLPLLQKGVPNLPKQMSPFQEMMSVAQDGANVGQGDLSVRPIS
jgi:hypothetical protein